jgi:hypothetical protein
MGLLADIFSYGDTQKRRLRGLLDDPAGTLGLGATRAVEDQAGLLGLMDQAGVTPGSNSVLLDNKKRAAQQLADKAMESFGGLLGATVWHGSPHKFDKFDSSKIGTGEGAQAYGHGLYLAEAPSVAKSYADTLSQYHIGTRDGVKSGGDFADALVANAGDYPASLSSAIRSQANKVATDLANGKTAEQVIASMRSGPYARMYSGLADAVEKMSPTKAGGSLYKVDLPDEHIAKMLDWDKPMSEQPHVLKALGRLGIPASPTLTGEELIKGSLLKGLSNYDGIVIRGEEALRSKGIPGIRYLDGGSRGAGGGTSNFVVFPGNEGLLQILERNGQPIK